MWGRPELFLGSLFFDSYDSLHPLCLTRFDSDCSVYHLCTLHIPHLISTDLFGAMVNRRTVILTLSLQTEKPRLREETGLAQGHTVNEWLSWDWPQGLSEKTALFPGHSSPCQIPSHSRETGNSSFRSPPCSAHFLGKVETYSGRVFQGRAFLSLQSREI